MYIADGKAIQQKEQERVSQVKLATQLFLYKLADLRFNEDDLDELRQLLEQYTGGKYQIKALLDKVSENTETSKEKSVIDDFTNNTGKIILNIATRNRIHIDAGLLHITPAPECNAIDLKSCKDVREWDGWYSGGTLTVAIPEVKSCK
ncbi:MAG: hypothetical protein B7C24_14320 [Bacteroidetes bacterium 4572_77]|nr:MAG: hypothetical protein B7C24_14320 [Bacteroidetes bacterium 4572_77]